MKRPSIVFKFLFIATVTILAFFLPDETMGQTAPVFQSDDFSTSNLNPELWTFVDPRGDATLTMNGAQVEISVPAGVAHEVGTDGNMAPRIRQPAQDTDFEIEVKFESSVRERHQLQGIFIEENSSKFLHFDFYNDGSNIRIFAAVLANGSRSVKTNEVIPNGLALYMRVKREGAQWTQSFSHDGVNWVTSVSFAEVLSVTAVGAFVGNSGIEAPAYTGLIDYFFNTASRIEPEDGGRHTLTVNVIGGGKVTKNPDQPIYLAGEVVQLTAIPDASLSFHGWSGSLSGSDNPVTLTLSADYIIDATFTANDNPVIDVWYGPQQVFGQLGISQRWVNILGNVSDYDGIASLRYSLNGGPPLPLSIGPGNPRLVAMGDFNVEMAYANLLQGQNQVVLTATDKLGNITVKTVIIDFVSGTVWPEQYSIDWSSATKIQEVAQIVDGKWILEADGVRPQVPGYDRLIAIGDTTWRDYEVTVPITIHGFGFGVGGSIVGMVMRWDGHYDWGGDRPVLGWYPMGAIGAYEPHEASNSNGNLRIIGDQSLDLAKNPSRRLELGVPYIFKMRVETTPGLGGLYKFKVWQDGQPEPAEWDLSAQEGSSDLPKGSFLLIAHNTDASFGNVTVVPLNKLTIDNIQIQRFDNRAIITWTTNQPATTSVAYGQTAAYENGSVDDSTWVMEHHLTLEGLASGRLYHYQITAMDHNGYLVRSPDLTFRTAVPSIIVSDDFNAASFNAALWTFINPVGDAVLTMTGKEVAIAVPAGVSHDVWTAENLAPRIMQSANNANFEIEVKFSSELSAGVQIQGILIEQDSLNFLRFDFHYDGSNTEVFAATFTNGVPTVRSNREVSNGAPLYMRVRREDDRWTQFYSYDGTSWTVGASFVQVLAVAAVGAFVGNAGSNVPAHTGLIDYFLNTDDHPSVPVTDEMTVEAPAHFELRQNYPNPFNPETTIEFSLPTPGFVTVQIFTVKGEEVTELVAEALSAGRHKFQWNAQGLPSGVYFYRLSMAASGPMAPLAATRKLLLVK